MSKVRTFDFNGDPWIYVRSETRPHDGLGYVFVSARDGVEYTRFVTEWPPDFEPINDTTGRAEANALALLAEAERVKAEALATAMRALSGSADVRMVEEARQVYLDELEKAGIAVE